MALGIVRASGPLFFFVAIWGLVLTLLISWISGPATSTSNATSKPKTVVKSSTISTTNSKITVKSGFKTTQSRSTTTSTTSTPPKPQTTDLDKGLLNAAAAGSAADTLFYLNRGARPGVVDSSLYTPLHLAARKGNVETINLLLKYTDAIWFADGNATPLHLAAGYGHAAAVKRIISSRKRDWPRERASSRHAVKRIQDAMNHRFDKELQAFFERKTYSARELAVIYGHGEIATSFPSASNDDLPHAFSCACLLGNVKMMEILWNHNQQRSSSSRHSKLSGAVRWFPAPPLHLAVMSGNRAAVAFLLEKGFKANDMSASTWREAYPPYSSPAHYAAVVGPPELLLALEKRGVDLTAKDYANRTPLSYAVSHLNVAVVELLVKRKHRRQGNLWSDNTTAYYTYLGVGHVDKFKDSNLKDIKSPRIVKALKGVGFKK